MIRQRPPVDCNCLCGHNAPEHGMLHGDAGKFGHIARRRIMIFIVQAVGIGERWIGHAQSPRRLVHALYEYRLIAAADVFRDRHARVVARREQKPV